MAFMIFDKGKETIIIFGWKRKFELLEGVKRNYAF